MYCVMCVNRLMIDMMDRKWMQSVIAMLGSSDKNTGVPGGFVVKTHAISGSCDHSGSSPAGDLCCMTFPFSVSTATGNFVSWSTDGNFDRQCCSHNQSQICAYGSRRMATNQQPEFSVPRIVHCGQFSFGCFHVCVTVFITGFWRLVQYQLSLSCDRVGAHVRGWNEDRALQYASALSSSPRPDTAACITVAKVLNQPLISPGQGFYSSSDNSEKT